MTPSGRLIATGTSIYWASLNKANRSVKLDLTLDRATDRDRPDRVGWHPCDELARTRLPEL